MRKGLAAQRLVAVFLTGALLFNYPVLSLVDRPDPWFGLPVLWVFLFATWAALLAVVAWIVERGAR
jgi:predicted permease